MVPPRRKPKRSTLITPSLNRRCLSITSGGIPSRWGMAVLALGIGVLGNREVPPAAVPVYAADAGQSELWLSDDGLVAGAPTFDALTDEALEQLLEELGSGGAA